MKKILAGLMVVVFLFGAAIAGVSNEQQTTGNEQMYLSNMETIEKTYTFAEPVISNEGTYVTVSMDDTKSIMQEGKPILPYRVDIMRFPVGTTIDIQVNQGPTKEIQLAWKIKPYSMFTLMTTMQKLVVQEGAVYQSNDTFPEQVVDQRITVGLYNGELVETLSLFIYPCQYTPCNDQLAYTDIVKVIVTYKPPTQSLFTNDSYDFLIISPKAWETNLQPLVDHKISHQVKTKLVCLDCIYSGEYFAVQGLDDAEKIKYFIKNAIEEWGIRYVMLVGGRQGGLFQEKYYMPVRYSNNDDGSNWDFKYLSDLYFADIYKYQNGTPAFDDWDSNGNGIFAEWSGFKKDTIDLSPDVYLGRLACRSTRDVDRIVQKIIDYENTYVKNENWFKKMVVVGGDTFSPEYGDNSGVWEGELSCDTALGYMDGFEGVKLYASLGTFTGVQDVIGTVNQGCGFLNFEGHGNPMGWSTHPANDTDGIWIDGLANSDMSKLSNVGKSPICVVGGCHNSQFNVTILNWLKVWELLPRNWQSSVYYKGETAADCWSWLLTSTKSGGGSIATIGCTGLGYGSLGADAIAGSGGWIDIEFFRVYGQDGKNVLGEVHSTAIANYVAQFPVMKDQIDCKTVQEWALLGDPTLMIGGYAL